MNQSNEKTGVWHTMYLRLIVAEPENEYQQELWDSFQNEFRGHPEAEALRIRYRTMVFVFTNGLMLVDFLAKIALGMMGQPVAIESWAMLVSLLATIILPPLDHSYVRAKIKQQAAKNEQHPKLAETLLWFFLPPAQCESAVGDLNENYAHRRQLKNLRYARLWYWWHTLRSLSPIVDGAIERLIKWGIAGAVLDWIRRHV